jgi:hypothetical protein
VMKDREDRARLAREVLRFAVEAFS